MKVNKLGRVYQRKDRVWPWGYYIPYKIGMEKGQNGHFVASTKQEAVKQANKSR